MIETQPDIIKTFFTLPPDAKFVPVSELSARLRARIGAVEDGQSVITRPGFRVTTRLVPAPLAELIAEFRAPSLLTDAVLRFARAHDQDPFATLDLAFDALATFVDARILVPEGSPDATAPVPSLAIGQEFAGYEVEALIRSLEDSEVYRAQGANGAVALKIARDDRAAVKVMLANEAQVLERLRGIDTPRLLESRLECERPYLAMEWCDGVSIAVVAQQARAAQDRRRLHAVVSAMLDAYARLHQRGVLHGDVHPGNCMVRDDGRVVILDFGNARPIESTSAVDPLRSGVPQFHDPQLAAAVLAGNVPPAATAISEQYAVSVLAYLLLTGLQPIDAPAVQDELMRRIVARPPLPFTARGVAAWPEVEAVIRRGLAKEPADRFAEMASMARAFSSARMPRKRSLRRSHAFDAAIESVRTLAPCAEPHESAWFALRAALALEDAELLAAADVLANRGAPSVAALVARARSDSRAESKAIARFIAGEPDLRATATLFESTNARALGDWLSVRCDGAEPAQIYAALTLAKTGAIAPPAPLPSRVDGDVWLWALAYDVYAEERFRTLALCAPLPSHPLHRGLALLRLHQLTGEMQWVTAARRMCARASGFEQALLTAELLAPERVMLPPWLDQVPSVNHSRASLMESKIRWRQGEPTITAS